jgi:hypothetical protein
MKDWAKGSFTGTVDDAKLDRAITAASRAIDHYCRRQFGQTGGARTYDTTDRSLLEVDDVATVSAIKTDLDGDGVYETTWATTDWQVLPETPAFEPEPATLILAVGDKLFPVRTSGRVGRIQVTGTWGWPEVPAPVKQACLLAARRLVDRKDSPSGFQGFDDIGVIRISPRDDPDAVRMLNPYRHEVVAIA